MADARQKLIQSFAFVIAVFLAFCFSFYFAYGFSGADKDYRIQLEGRINPNNAPIASLVRLPGVGISRAGAIVAYRENFNGKDGENQAFQSCNDLQKIKGIGPKTAQNIGKYLRFK